MGKKANAINKVAKAIDASADASSNSVKGALKSLIVACDSSAEPQGDSVPGLIEQIAQVVPSGGGGGSWDLGPIANLVSQDSEEGSGVSASWYPFPPSQTEMPQSTEGATAKFSGGYGNAAQGMRMLVVYDTSSISRIASVSTTMGQNVEFESGTIGGKPAAWFQIPDGLAANVGLAVTVDL